MKTRMFLAVGLSLLVLLFWQGFVTRTHPVEKKDVFEKTYLPREEKSQILPLSPSPLSSSDEKNEERKVEWLGEYSTDKISLEFSNPGGKLSKVYLKDYGLKTQISNGLYSGRFQNGIYTFKKTNDSVELDINENGHLNVQKLNFTNSAYIIELETIYRNNTSKNWTLNDEIILDSALKNIKVEEERLYEVVFIDNNKRASVRKNLFSIKNDYKHIQPWTALAFRDRYASIVLQPQDPSMFIPYVNSQKHSSQIGLALKNIEIPPDSQVSFKSIIYCGPQNYGILKDIGLGFEGIIHYGTFDFISSALLRVMDFFHKITRNWGVALILLSVFIYIFLYPLTLKQMRSMRQMQELQPKIEALKKAHKDNPTKQNKEIMEFYRKNKVNPMGGCLPMLLQIPIFFGLYQALSRSIALKGSGFLWIKDLAEPDRLFLLPQPLPFLGNEINLLPILMAVAMFFQQKLSLKTNTAGGQAMEQQKMMLVLMPVIFGVIFYHFPSGLALYWFLNTGLSTLSQWKTLKEKNQSQEN